MKMPLDGQKPKRPQTFEFQKWPFFYYFNTTYNLPNLIIIFFVLFFFFLFILISCFFYTFFYWKEVNWLVKWGVYRPMTWRSTSISAKKKGLIRMVGPGTRSQWCGFQRKSYLCPQVVLYQKGCSLKIENIKPAVSRALYQAVPRQKQEDNCPSFQERQQRKYSFTREKAREYLVSWRRITS